MNFQDSKVLLMKQAKALDLNQRRRTRSRSKNHLENQAWKKNLLRSHQRNPRMNQNPPAKVQRNQRNE